MHSHVRLKLGKSRFLEDRIKRIDREYGQRRGRGGQASAAARAAALPADTSLRVKVVGAPVGAVLVT